MKRSATLLCLSFIALANADQIDAVIRQEMAKSRIPGLALGIMEKGKLSEIRTYGVVDLENKLATRKNSAFEIGSISKQFTAAAVLLLAEDGKLSLDDPVSKHYPACPEKWKALTIRQCLTHTAGLKDTVTGMETLTFRKGDYYKAPGNLPLDFEPATSWSYSNMGYELVADMVEEITKKKMDEVLRERIWKPLKMTNTAFSDLKVLIPGRAKGYAATDKGYTNALPINAQAAHGAGAIVSNVADMAKWNQALFNGKLLKPASMAEFWKSTTLKDGSDTEYALGWSVYDDGEHRIVEHGGNTLGFSAGNFTIPSQKKAYIVLTNLAMVNGAGIAHRVLGAADPSFDLSKRRQTPDPAPERMLRLMMAFRSFSHNRADYEPFNPNVVSTLKSLRGLNTKMSYAGIAKAAKTYHHIETLPTPRGSRSIYAMELGPSRLYVAVRWTTDGKVEKFTPLYTEPKEPKESKP